jgi:SAM-dependent methyltransferase
MDKRAFYRRESVVEHYDAWRFGSAGGRYVDEIEKDMMRSLLVDVDRGARVLDLPCGTGRLARVLLDAGFGDVLCADASEAMLARARKAVPEASFELVDAFATGFSDERFDVICSLRFLFHVGDASSYFAEVRRILAPGGYFAFDSLRWTPRGLLPPVDRALGGRLYCHGDKAVARLLAEHGFEPLRQVRVFALPSLAYRFLPATLVPAMRFIEARVPRSGFTKTFHLARKLA